MGKRHRVGVGVAACVALGSSVQPAAAAAEEQERFGERGQVVLDQSFLGGALHMRHHDPELKGLTTTSLQLSPRLSYFVVRNLSVSAGLSVGLSWAEAEGVDFGSESHLGGNIGVGYAVRLGEHFSLWPQARFSVTHAWSAGAPVPPDPDTESMSTGGWLPLLWHPAEHLFVGMGPGVYASLRGPTLGALERDMTFLSLHAMVGGYFSP